MEIAAREAWTMFEAGISEHVPSHFAIYTSEVKLVKKAKEVLRQVSGI